MWHEYSQGIRPKVDLSLRREPRILRKVAIVNTLEPLRNTLEHA